MTWGGRFQQSQMMRNNRLGGMMVNRAHRAVAVLAGASALLLGLTSCALLEGPTPTIPERPAIPVPETPPALVPDGSAADNEAFFALVLQDFVAGAQPVEGVPIVNALADAGFNRDVMQISFDHTRTNLVADSMFVSVRYGEECLLGQITTDTRELAVDLGPTVGPDRNICLIGQTRPIDW